MFIFQNSAWKSAPLPYFVTLSNIWLPGPAKIYTIINFTSKDNLDNRALHDSPFIIVQILLLPIKYNKKGSLPYSRIIVVQFAPKLGLYSTLVSV